LKVNDTVILKGPLGPGLGIDNLSGHFIAIAGGTGILPFLDLVHYIWTNRKNPHQFTFTLYASFRNREDVVALDLINVTQSEVNEDVFKFILVITGEKKCENIPEIINGLGKENPKRAWICGPSGFNRVMLDYLLISGLERNKIVVM